MADRQVTPLEAALTGLRTAVGRAALPLPLPGAAEQRQAVREITAQLDDYVLPRLASIDAPLAGRGRWVDRRRQVDPGQLAGRAAGE